MSNEHDWISQAGDVGREFTESHAQAMATLDIDPSETIREELLMNIVHINPETFERTELGAIDLCNLDEYKVQGDPVVLLDILETQNHRGVLFNRLPTPDQNIIRIDSPLFGLCWVNDSEILVQPTGWGTGSNPSADSINKFLDDLGLGNNEEDDDNNPF